MAFELTTSAGLATAPPTTSNDHLSLGAALREACLRLVARRPNAVRDPDPFSSQSHFLLPGWPRA